MTHHWLNVVHLCSDTCTGLRVPTLSGAPHTCMWQGKTRFSNCVSTLCRYVLYLWCSMYCNTVYPKLWPETHLRSQEMPQGDATLHSIYFSFLYLSIFFGDLVSFFSLRSRLIFFFVYILSFIWDFNFYMWFLSLNYIWVVNFLTKRYSVKLFLCYFYFWVHRTIWRLPLRARGKTCFVCSSPFYILSFSFW